ncbi:MerR family transcriptional regulator [Gracilibacillus sp. HCP3S3_G5_1]|uniref:MerR family transcriptional regulator n=1 Tax=unclassified Gracilibacillus TaxID=2625209 RepID=UPI003F8A8CA0
MKISELARLTNVSSRSIRHYEKKGLLRAYRLENNYREFEESAVSRIKAIKLYLKLGLTTDEIETLFREEVAVPDEYEYCEEMLSIYKEKLNMVKHQVEALRELERRLERQIALTIANK